MRNLGHIVRVLRPTQTLDEYGQLAGRDTVIFRDWPCSIETLSGRKADEAHTIVAEATHSVEGWGNPANNISVKDYLLFGARRFDVQHVNDVRLNGTELKLLCTEVLTGG